MVRSLKEQNNWKLWLIVAANVLFFYGVLVTNGISLNGLRAVFSEAQSLLPISFAGIVATVLNSLPHSTTKARLVYLRWDNALPAHRAFSRYATQDARINMGTLKKLFKGKLPTEPRAQNEEWYKLFRTVENEVKVYEVHRDFLLLRDYTSLAVLSLVTFGSLGFVLFTTVRTAGFYLLILVVQFLVVRQAAANCGIRMVTNVLALKTSRAAKSSPD